MYTTTINEKRVYKCEREQGVVYVRFWMEENERGQMM